jgi:hypothetical protein
VGLRCISRNASAMAAMPRPRRRQRVGQHRLSGRWQKPGPPDVLVEQAAVFRLKRLAVPGSNSPG